MPKITNRSRGKSSKRPALRHLVNKAAKRLCRAGFTIVPLESAERGDAATGKRPITRHGVNDGTSDYRLFRSLVAPSTPMNLGIVTGPGSDVLVIDIDPRNGGNETMKKLLATLGPLPDGPVCDTGGSGRHLYFKFPPDFLFNKTTLGDGIDVLGDNSYVVGPPSRHFSGKRYRWQGGRSLTTCAVPPLPQPWLDAIVARTNKRTPMNIPAASASVQVDRGSGGKGGNTRLSSIPEGQRNNTLTSLAGSLRAGGRNIAEIATELHRVNQEHCQPPLDAAEVDKILGSAAGWAPVSAAGDAELLAKRLLERDYRGGAHLRRERDGQFYEFNSTHWAPIAAAQLVKRLFAIIQNEFPGVRKRLNATAKEALSIIGTLTSQDDDLLHFETPPPPVINVLNGEIWLLSDGSHELRAHTYATGCRHVLAVNYDPQAKCPRFTKALLEIFSKARNPNRVCKRWRQTMGYIAQPSRPRALVLVLYGSGGNGKSLLVSVLQQLLGSDAVHSGDITQLENNRFALSGLVGKLLLVDDDVKTGSQLPDGMLKKLSEEKLLTAERKHQDPFNFVHRAVPMLLCNNMPSVTDVSPGMKRRLVVFKFDREFAENEQDHSLAAYIRNHEMAGVLNLALRGWREFVENDRRFTPSKDIERASREFMAQSNSFSVFIEEAFERSPEGRVRLNDLFAAYTRWADEAGYRNVITRNKVRQHLKHYKFSFVQHSGYTTVVGLKLTGQRRAGADL